MNNGVRKLIKEVLEEIDWEDTFSDAKQQCLNPDAVVKYLNRVRANAAKDYKDREKFKRNISPYSYLPRSWGIC